MIGNQAIGEEEGFNVCRDDGFHKPADDWEKVDWSVVAGICFCTFLAERQCLLISKQMADDLEQMRGGIEQREGDGLIQIKLGGQVGCVTTKN